MKTKLLATPISQTAMKTGPIMADMLAFARRYPGPHSIVCARRELGALRRLTKQGRMVTLTVGKTVMFELPVA